MSDKGNDAAQAAKAEAEAAKAEADKNKEIHPLLTF